MFTGLVESTGTVDSVKINSDSSKTSAILRITDHNCNEVKFGDSIAINGCCLTVTDFSREHLSFDVSQETLNCTQLGSLSVGDKVNIERSVGLNSRLDGHLVSGHVDSKATICIVEKQQEYWLLGLAIPSSHAGNVIDKGSICINGVSLTINRISDKENVSVIELMLIPTTIAKTNLALLKLDQEVNIEYDMIGKYIKRQIQLEHLNSNQSSN